MLPINCKYEIFPTCQIALFKAIHFFSIFSNMSAFFKTTFCFGEILSEAINVISAVIIQIETTFDTVQKKPTTSEKHL